LNEIENLGGDPSFLFDPSEFTKKIIDQTIQAKSSTPSTTRIIDNAILSEYKKVSFNNEDDIGGDTSFLDITSSNDEIRNDDDTTFVVTTINTNTNTCTDNRQSSRGKKYENKIYEIEKMGGDPSFFIDSDEFTKSIDIFTVVPTPTLTTTTSTIITSTTQDDTNTINQCVDTTTNTSRNDEYSNNIDLDEIESIGGDVSFLLEPDEVSKIISQTLVTTTTTTTIDNVEPSVVVSTEQVTPKWEWDGIVDEEAHLGFL
jgi:hypothetical protein